MVPTRTSLDVLDKLVASTNAHDLDGLVECFVDGYELTDPVHPARSFTGVRQVRRNWTTFFETVPDLRLDVQQQAVTADGFWLEACQAGTRRDGVHLKAQMVFIATVSGGRIASARIYVAPVETGGPDIDTVIGAMAGTLAPRRVGPDVGAES